MRDNRQDPTPYAVICPTHGIVFLNEEQYDYQMDRPHESWVCPQCKGRASWDDDCLTTSPPDEENA